MFLVPRYVCNEVFNQSHKALRRSLNLHEAFPHLKSHNLLPHSKDHSEILDYTLTREKRIDKAISWLPLNGISDYLTPFISCLRESTGDAGDAHQELADILEEQCDVELKRYKYGKTVYW